jgi:hypothetical protein
VVALLPLWGFAVLVSFSNEFFSFVPKKKTKKLKNAALFVPN